ncbi:MAG: epoxyqueuosine reductase QueH [Clostridia bacterium]
MNISNLHTNINFQSELDEIITNLNGTRPKLLLHCCCAPCASYCLEYLSKYFDITAIFINDNIESIEEYYKRANELVRLISEMPLASKVECVICPYNGQLFLDRAKGLENFTEGGPRCGICFTDRLRATCLYGIKNKFDYFTTTLTISPLKNSILINDIGMAISKSTNNLIKWLPSNFKKKGGYLRSIQLSKEYNLYRQNYCGCIFSKNEAITKANKKG